MGLTYVRIQVSRDTTSPPQTVSALVDTGATHTMIPRTTLESLGVVPVRRRPVRLADGRETHRDFGSAFVRCESRETWTWVLFGEAGDATVLGALTLEELSLQVDVESQQLRDAGAALLIMAAA